MYARIVNSPVEIVISDINQRTEPVTIMTHSRNKSKSSVYTLYIGRAVCVRVLDPRGVGIAVL